VSEQPIRVDIDNSSIFTPGSSTPQLGFRRSELIAQESKNGNRTAFDATLESGVTAFHFSVYADENRPLNYTHEYQTVWIEQSDGTHVFDLQIGTCRERKSEKPFENGLTDARMGRDSRCLSVHRDTLQYNVFVLHLL
jgi:hypothetical protein